MAFAFSEGVLRDICLSMRILALLLIALLALPASAQIRWSGASDVVELTVRPGWRDPAGDHMTALQFDLAAGWKTYWRSPGATGIAPRFTWSGTENLSDLTVLWPRPSVVMTAGEPSLGYYDRLVLPLRLRPLDPTRPIRLRGVLDIGVCETVCLPAKLQVDVILPAVGAPDATISAALADQTPTLAANVHCTIRPSDDGLALSARLPDPRSAAAPYVAVEMAGAQERVWITDTLVQREADALRTQTEFMVADGAALYIRRDALRFTVVTPDRAVEYNGCAR